MRGVGRGLQPTEDHRAPGVALLQHLRHALPHRGEGHDVHDAVEHCGEGDPEDHHLLHAEHVEELLGLRAQGVVGAVEKAPHPRGVEVRPEVEGPRVLGDGLAHLRVEVPLPDVAVAQAVQVPHERGHPELHHLVVVLPVDLQRAKGRADEADAVRRRTRRCHDPLFLRRCPPASKGRAPRREELLRGAPTRLAGIPPLRALEHPQQRPLPVHRTQLRLAVRGHVPVVQPRAHLREGAAVTRRGPRAAVVRDAALHQHRAVAVDGEHRLIHEVRREEQLVVEHAQREVRHLHPRAPRPRQAHGLAHRGHLLGVAPHQRHVGPLAPLEAVLEAQRANALVEQHLRDLRQPQRVARGHHGGRAQHHGVALPERAQVLHPLLEGVEGALAVHHRVVQRRVVAVDGEINVREPRGQHLLGPPRALELDPVGVDRDRREAQLPPAATELREARVHRGLAPREAQRRAALRPRVGDAREDRLVLGVQLRAVEDVEHAAEAAVRVAEGLPYSWSCSLRDRPVSSRTDPR